MDEEYLNNGATVIAAIGAANANARSYPPPATADSTPFAVIPEGYKLEDLERLYPTPRRARGNFTLREAASFIAFVNANKVPGTRIFGDLNIKADASKIEPPRFVAVFDDHLREGTPGWREHSAVFQAVFSPEWVRWIANNTKRMAQVTFAEFIEDNAVDCVDSAMLLEVGRTFEAKKAVKYASVVRLADGSLNMNYEDTTTATAGKGNFAVPESFDIAIPVLQGDTVRTKLTARFRYRLDGGVLQLWYDLLTPHKAYEVAARDVWQDIADRVANVPIYNGQG